MELDTTDLTADELAILQHTIQAIRRSRTQGLHFFSNFLGLEWESVGNGLARVTMPIGPQIRNTRRVAQGGAVATLADLAMGSAVRSALPPGKRVVTVEMKVNYLRPGGGRELWAEAQCVYAGRRLGVADARITNDQGTLIAIANGTFAVVEPLNQNEPDPGNPTTFA